MRRAACLVVVLSSLSAHTVFTPQLSWFLDGAVLEAPGNEAMMPLPPDCVSTNTCPKEVEVSYWYDIKLEDGTVVAYDAAGWRSPATPEGWTTYPTENEILVDNAIGKMEAAAVQQIATNASNTIGEKVVSQVSSSQSSFFSRLTSTTSWGVRWLSGRLAVS